MPTNLGSQWRTRKLRVLSHCLKRFKKCSIYYQAWFLTLVCFIGLAVPESLVVATAVSRGCSSILTSSVEPECREPFLKLYDFLEYKAKLVTVAITVMIYTRFVHIIVILLSPIIATGMSKWFRKRGEDCAKQLDVSRNTSLGFDSFGSRFRDVTGISDWSFVASQDVNEEVVSSLKKSVIDMLFITSLVAAISTMPGCLVQLSEIGWDWRNASEAHVAFMDHTCGDSSAWTFCHFSFINRRWLTDLMRQVAFSVQNALCLAPIGVYHRQGLAAARRIGQLRFVAAFLILVPILRCIIDPAIYWSLRERTSNQVLTAQATKSEFVQYFLGLYLTFFLGIGLYLFMFNTDLAIVQLGVQAWKSFTGFWKRVYASRLTGKCNKVHPDVQLSSLDHNSEFRGGGLALLWHHLRGLVTQFYAPRGGGVMVRKLVFLSNCILTWLPTGHGNGYFAFGLTWACRILFLALFLIQRDGESTFDSLRQEGAGFGLLVDADDLRQALDAFFEGATYDKHIRRYQGTMFRMKNTMALSYRWKAERQCLAYGLYVNMSHWQLKQLYKGMLQTGCMYVWIDALSIPQDGSDLQMQLLTRMMAIYSSCRDCLILRTLEADTSRYHQRAWTFQEWCSCNNRIVVTERETSWSPANNDEESSLCCEHSLKAVIPVETKCYENFRLWTKSQVYYTVPLWLSDGGSLLEMPEDKFRTVWADLVIVMISVKCQVPMDKIRALFPTIWNMPTSTTQELQSLSYQVLRRAANLKLAVPSMISNQQNDMQAMPSTPSGDDIPMMEHSQISSSPMKICLSSVSANASMRTKALETLYFNEGNDGRCAIEQEISSLIRNFSFQNVQVSSTGCDNESIFDDTDSSC